MGTAWQSCQPVTGLLQRRSNHSGRKYSDEVTSKAFSDLARCVPPLIGGNYAKVHVRCKKKKRERKRILVNKRCRLIIFNT